MKKLALVLSLLVLFPIASASSINPSTLTTNIQLNGYATATFNLILSNETCYPNVSSQLEIYGLPSFNGATGNFTINALIKPTADTNPGTYTSTISYCDSSITINSYVSSPTNQSGSDNCPAYVKIYGEKVAGKTIKFDIRNMNYQRVRNPDTSISIESSDTGNTYSVDCQEGSCSWKIPESEKGTLISEIIIPSCQPFTQEIELKPAGQISVSVPNDVMMGDDFYVYFFDPTRGALKWVTVQVISPNGQAFNGKTDENGILRDESLTKIYGKDIKPDKIGAYTLFANLPGYSSVNKTFNVIKVDCPFECCVGEEKYVEKPCQSGFECSDNECIQIEKPNLEINCTPEPTLTKTSHCVILSNGTKLNKDVDVKITLNDETKTVTFTNGEHDISFDHKGDYKIEASLEGYDKGVLSGTVLLPQASVSVFSVVIFVLVVIIIVVLLYILRKKGILRGKPKVTWETAPSSESYPVEEE